MNTHPHHPPLGGFNNNGRLTGATAPGANSSAAAATTSRNNFSVIGQSTTNVSGIVDNVSNPYHYTNRKRDRDNNFSSNHLGRGDGLLPSTKQQHTQNSGNYISAGEPQQQNSSYAPLINNNGGGNTTLSYNHQQQQSQLDQYNFSYDDSFNDIDFADIDRNIATHDTSKLSTVDEFYNSDIDGEFGNDEEVTAFLAASEAKSRVPAVGVDDNFSDDESYTSGDFAGFAAHDKPIEVGKEDLSHTQQLGLLLFRSIMDEKLGKLDAVNGNTLSIVIGEERIAGPKLLFLDGIFEHVMKHDDLISSLMSGCDVCIGLLQNIRDECESAFSDDQMCLLRSVTRALTILGDISPSYDLYPGECVGGMERGVKMGALNGCKY